MVFMSFCAYAQQPVDDQISERVKVFLVKKEFDPKIQVITINRIVYLSGKITTLAQRNEAMKLVQQIPGVKTVRSLLIVDSKNE